MKEKLYTIEVMDALKAMDECPCCHLERKIEQDTISFVLGASYMEDDIRGATDQAGFCRRHTKMMYDYGNSLGNAWILKTRMDYMRKQLKAQAQGKMTAPSANKGPVAGFTRKSLRCFRVLPVSTVQGRGRNQKFPQKARESPIG